MRSYITAYLPGQEPGQDPRSASIAVDIHRRQISDRMTSDYYVTFGTVVGGPIFTIPFRQLKSLVDGMIERGEWE